MIVFLYLKKYLDLAKRIKHIKFLLYLMLITQYEVLDSLPSKIMRNQSKEIVTELDYQSIVFLYYGLQEPFEDYVTIFDVVIW